MDFWMMVTAVSCAALALHFCVDDMPGKDKKAAEKSRRALLDRQLPDLVGRTVELTFKPGVVERVALLDMDDTWVRYRKVNEKKYVASVIRRSWIEAVREVR